MCASCSGLGNFWLSWVLSPCRTYSQLAIQELGWGLQGQGVENCLPVTGFDPTAGLGYSPWGCEVCGAGNTLSGQDLTLLPHVSLKCFEPDSSSSLSQPNSKVQSILFQNKQVNYKWIQCQRSHGTST